jgi:exopolysaccharide production protein ExoY
MASVPFLQTYQEQSCPGTSWRSAGAIGERLLAAALLLFALPVLAASALAVCLLSRRGPWIAHRRVGWRGADLWMIKLRTMWQPGAAASRFQWVEYIEDHAGPERKQSGDPRVASAFARYCRRHSIDELPQLWHVVRGEMSLVGPRPITADELRRHYGDQADDVLALKPGLAGLWQVSGRNRLTYAQRCALDLEMVRRRSFSLYLSIFLKALPQVVRGEDSW